ncbi:MAG: hypothetical protein ABI905_07945 [Betaproteobacteria bacterium]
MSETGAAGPHDLALGFLARGELDAALVQAQAAVASDTANIDFRETLARVHYRRGELPAVISLYEAIVAAQPQYFAAWKRLSRLLLENWQFERADEVISRALQIDGNDVALLALQVYARHELGLDAQARDAAIAATARHPDQLSLALDAKLLLPMIYQGTGALHESRAAYTRAMAALTAELPRWKKHALQVLSLERSNFLLAYQGQNDRDLQKQYATFIGELIGTAAPELRQALPCTFDGQRKLRIGFVGKWFYDSTAGNYFERWITQLDPARFERFVFYTGQGEDAVTRRIEAGSEHFSRLFNGPAADGQRILADKLDVLVHPEVGMSTGSCLLSAMRLAPVQMAAWGHPVTTGSAVVDYFLSCGAMEPIDHAAHYTEKLILFEGIGVDIALPATVRNIARSSFGLPAGARLYFCPQSLFKIHPDMDAVFLKIIEADPAAVLVFFQAGTRAITMSFANRLGEQFARAGVQAKGQVKFLPRLSGEKFRSALTLADVMLDTLHWSGGGTSLDAFAADVPVISLPGEFMRGRQTAAMLRLMGLEKLIAADVDDYVRKAVDIASNRGINESIREAIARGKLNLFGRAEASSDFAAKVFAAVAAHAGNTSRS